VRMDKEPGQKCFWKLCPYNTSRNDGDRVLQSDTLLLQHIKSGFCIHTKEEGEEKRPQISLKSEDWASFFCSFRGIRNFLQEKEV
jgi:hypothetical protein